MGEFVASSAFQTEQVDQVTEAVLRFLDRWTAAVVPDGETDESNDVLVFASDNGWTVVLWPTYFTDVPAAQFVSGQLDVVASTVHVHDGDYWAHTLLRGGSVLDRFASMVDYFTDDAAVIAELRRTWSGNPIIVADAVQRPVMELVPYLVHISLEDDEDYEDEPEPVKAFADDEFALDDAWVFTDFWRRLGISYPRDVTRFATRIRLADGWFGKLPTGDESDL